MEMSIADDYMELVETIGAALVLPPVQALHIGPSRASLKSGNKFAAMVLADGTVGLTYTALDDVWSALQDPAKTHSLVGTTPLRTARLYANDALWERCLGMAGVNAISQFLLKQSGYALDTMGKTVDQLALENNDHVGMVGFFPSLVEQIRSRGLALTVLELDEQWLQCEGNFEVTLDPRRLHACNKIICTGTTLVNHTIDSVLGDCEGAEQVIVVGPTCGCLPDPLFERGVHALGGSGIPDSHAFLKRWGAEEKWRETVQRYVVRNDEHYPGYHALVAAVKDR